MTKTDAGFVRKLDFKDIKFPVKIRDIHKIKKENFIGISVFGYENEGKHPIYVLKKCYEEKNVDLLLIGEEGKRHYVPLKLLILSCMIILYIVEKLDTLHLLLFTNF